MSQGCVANGDIAPSRILILDTSAGANKVIQASSATASPLYGVAQAGTRNTPLTGLDTGFAASAGDNIAVFTAGDRVQVEIGAAVSAGNLLTSDTNGRAIAATSTNYVIGEAIDSGTALGQLIEMRVMPYKI